MKQIHDLDISPTPWKSDNDFRVEDANGDYFIDYDCEFCRNADTHIVAAAPDMARVLYSLIEWSYWRDASIEDIIVAAKKAYSKAINDEVE